ncbi:N-acetylmuramoyl-L-alanine amidase [Telmatospirillum sp. J64-1]|uniref:N-acetylmuramoyl-L-alanine amidase n=1 Tax=Telmatospirillum sp. J64-1 TaxID=2502183 RepID=UPI00115F0ABE|nr:N-acetylmuramoyl-L-alanine amidase [Telmatospirillum sp. J64-1]
MIETPSPNHEPRPPGQAVDMLVLHYTGMQTAQMALERMCDPQAKVSAHYMIHEDGRVVRLVPEEYRAWHAGLSCWRGQRDINSRSIGIELVNPGHEWGYRPFPEAQMAALIELAQGILARHPIPSHNVVGHSDVAPARKEDPGELFDWPRLARHGIGLWSDEQGRSTLTPEQAQALLARIGYDCPVTGEWDEASHLALLAFQRRFYPSRLDGLLDPGTAHRLKVIARLM